MYTGNSFRAPIEYFLLMHGEKVGRPTGEEKLVYYDAEGRCQERDLNAELLHVAMHVFDGRTKAIRRRSGGLAIAEPLQLVMYDEPATTKESGPKIRIKVKFKDFVLGDGGEAKYELHTKIVAPQDIFDPYANENLEEILHGNRFVLDFGSGIVPIHVFDQLRDAQGHQLALFIDEGDLKTIVSQTSKKKVWVQTYQIRKEVLRLGADRSEWQKAAENREKLHTQGTYLPAGLALGNPVEVPCGLTSEQLRRFLQKAFQSNGI